MTGLLFYSVYDFYKQTDYVDVAEVFAAANDVTDVRIIGSFIRWYGRPVDLPQVIEIFSRVECSGTSRMT